jgi:FAD:protein FMN transferase
LSRFLFFIVGFLFLSCTNQEEKEQVITGEALGTTYQVKFYHKEDLDLRKGLDSIFEVINSSMSTYQQDSDISKINSGRYHCKG